MATFVSPDWVAERIGQPGYLLIDPRSAMRYLMGHLRGAVSVPYKKLQAPDGRLGPPEQLAAAFGDVGLGDDVTPILYDHQDGRNAAMAAWVLEYLGRADVHIMDLRYEAWKDAGREVLYRPVVTRGANFTVRLNPAIRATLDDVANAGAATLVDARTTEEFRGEFEMDHRPGHIPGAVSLPHADLAGAGGNLYAGQDTLRERLAGAGISQGEPVIAYCRSGVRAAVTWLALEQMGYDARLYDGSYAEWMDSDQPVET
ncbi:MAG: sulfurtransferase [Chloroflexota bacterium]|nr:sulfurtransferase [Chloroflexota bacterium]MDE2959514.1 sulfurtransferase [Chloroflexota bacterium]